MTLSLLAGRTVALTITSALAFKGGFCAYVVNTKPYILTYFLKIYFLHRGSYTTAHVLLILLNELGKRDKMRGLSSILSLFSNGLDKFNKTRARMLDSIYHMTLRILLNLISGVKMLRFCHYEVLTFSRKSVNH